MQGAWADRVVQGDGRLNTSRVSDCITGGDGVERRWRQGGGVKVGRSHTRENAGGARDGKSYSEPKR